MSNNFPAHVSRAFRLRRALRTHKKKPPALPWLPAGKDAYVPPTPVGVELRLGPDVQGDTASMVWLADLAGQSGGAELRVQTLTISVAASVPERVKKRVLQCPIVTELQSLHWTPPTPTPLGQDPDVVDYLTAWGTRQLHTLWLDPNRSANGSVHLRHAGNLRKLFALELPVLEHLAIPGVELGHRGMRYFKSCAYIPGLRSLDMSWSKVDDFEALASVLATATELKVLSLSHVLLNGADLAAIAAATPGLQELDITYTEIEEDAAEALMTFVERGITLRASHNRLPAAVNKALTEAAEASGAEISVGYRLPKKK